MPILRDFFHILPAKIGYLEKLSYLRPLKISLAITSLDHLQDITLLPL